MTERRYTAEELKAKKSTSSPFFRHSRDKKALYERRRASKDEADAYFKGLFGQNISWIIVANITAGYTTKYQKSANTFEEAWQGLDYQEITGIIFRAINGLPASGKQEVKSKVTMLSDYQNRKRVY